MKGAAFDGAPTASLTITLDGSATPTDTTIIQSFHSNEFTSSTLACGTTLGSYTQQAVDNNVVNGLTHQQGVGGLTPSTPYFCQAAVTNNGTTVTANFTATTTATPASTAITGLVVGTPTGYNSINVSNQGDADTFYNCKSNDGSTYMTLGDSNDGFRISGAPAYTGGGQFSLMKVLNESPLTIQTFNFMPNYGNFGVNLSDGLSSKIAGAFCMGGNIFLTTGRQNQAMSQANGAFAQTIGNVVMSYDKGVTWNNPDNLGSFGSYPRNPLSASMFGTTPTQMGTADFVMYCADDGTLGYTAACNEHDNGNLWVYLIANEGAWNGGGTQGGGNAYYIARVARAKLSHLNGSDYQWYTGGDGNLDANWSSTQSAAVAILTNTGHLGTADIEYIPAKNRYLLLTFYYAGGVTNGGSRLNSFWLGYEAQHPWGPWTQIFSQQFTGSDGGAYNPIVLADTKFSGTTPTILWTGNFVSDYFMYFATLTIN